MPSPRPRAPPACPPGAGQNIPASAKETLPSACKTKCKEKQKNPKITHSFRVSLCPAFLRQNLLSSP